MVTHQCGTWTITNLCRHLSDLAERLDEPAAFLSVPPADMTLWCAPVDQEVRMVWNLDKGGCSRWSCWDGVSLTTP